MTSATEIVSSSPSSLPKILLGDDHALILDALSQLMKDNFDVLAVDNSQSFIEAVDGFRPDVAVLDISMPGGDGFTTARHALERKPDLPIVFLSMHTDPSYKAQAARLGARAFVSKRLPAHELLSTIERVLNREDVPEAEVSTEPGSEDQRLTFRQREVLRLIAAGCTAKDIAQRLGISVRTAEFHRAAIIQRLGVHSTAQLTRYAIANDLG